MSKIEYGARLGDIITTVGEESVVIHKATLISISANNIVLEGNKDEA